MVYHRMNRMNSFAKGILGILSHFGGVPNGVRLLDHLLNPLIKKDHDSQCNLSCRDVCLCLIDRRHAETAR